jgi:multiple sugar transport system substrate-binding protein
MNLARILVLLAAASLTACSDAPDGETTIRFWAMGREGEIVKQLIPDFEKEHPGIRVAVQQTPWSAAHEKLLTSFAGDSLPDMAQLGNTWLPEFEAIGALAPLPPGVADESDYFPGIWSTNVVDGVAYGVPWYVDTRLLFYRTDILSQAGYDAPPTDWAGWIEAMRAVKSVVGPTRYAALLPLNEYEPLLALSLSADRGLLNDEGTRGDFSNPEFRRTLSLYRDIFAEKLAPNATANQIANVWDEFARGFFSFYITGPWNIAEFKRRLPDEMQDKWMTAPLPGPNGPGASIAGGSSPSCSKARRRRTRPSS